jgi:hypothetical protein
MATQALPWISPTILTGVNVVPLRFLCRPKRTHLPLTACAIIDCERNLTLRSA